MEVDQSGVKLPDKSQLTIVFKNGTTIQVMIALSGDALQQRLNNARGDNSQITLPSLVKDEKVFWDNLTLYPENIMFFSIIQPNPESLLHRVRPIAAPS